MGYGYTIHLVFIKGNIKNLVNEIDTIIPIYCLLSSCKFMNIFKRRRNMHFM